MTNIRCMLQSCRKKRNNVYQLHSYNIYQQYNSCNLGHPVVFEYSSITKCSNVAVTTQQCIYITSILLWQHILVLLYHLQAKIQRYEVQNTIYYSN
jgi:hypothetical protein